MNASADLWLFFLLVLGVILLPGMDMAYVAGSAVTGGLRSGSTAVAGIVSGGVVHVAVASTGIAVLLTVWPAAFDALLLAGAAYMAWIGAGMLRVSGGPLAREGAAVATPRRVFARAMLTCLLNPKAYAFTLAVFPAFIRQTQRPLPVQALLMSTIIALTQVMVYGGVALLAARTREFVGMGVSAQRGLLRLTGVLLVAGAVLTPMLGWKAAA